jgi:hypothetical protein
VLIPFLFAPFFLELLGDVLTLRQILWLDAILGLGVCAAMAFGDVLRQISNGTANSLACGKARKT